MARGYLHIFIAQDWGDGIDLARARDWLPAEARPLDRRRRTPPSIEFHPLPLRIRLPCIRIGQPGMEDSCFEAAVTLFDFGAVSISLRSPFAVDLDTLSSLATRFEEMGELLSAVNDAVGPLFVTLEPAIQDPLRSALSEEFLVFQIESLPAHGEVPGVSMLPERLLEERAAWLSGMVRLEQQETHPAEIAEALRLRICYTSHDLLVVDWAAAVLVDRDCEETLQIVEFANLQLLEYRLLDDRLDRTLARAYQVLVRANSARMPVLRGRSRDLRMLGELKVEASDLFERTANLVKLMGDQYLARVHRMLGERFHLQEWESSIRRKLDVLESTYRVLGDQANRRRGELLELTVIALILIEVILSLVAH